MAGRSFMIVFLLVAAPSVQAFRIQGKRASQHADGTQNDADLLQAQLFHAATEGRQVTLYALLDKITDRNFKTSILQEKAHTSRSWQGKVRRTTLLGAVLVEQDWCDTDCSKADGLMEVYFYLGCLYSELGLSAMPEANGYADAPTGPGYGDRGRFEAEGHMRPVCDKCGQNRNFMQCLQDFQNDVELLQSQLFDAATEGQQVTLYALLDKITDRNFKTSILQSFWHTSRSWQGKVRHTTLLGAVLVEQDWCDADCSKADGLMEVYFYLGCLYSELGLSAMPEANGYADAPTGPGYGDRGRFEAEGHMRPVCDKCGQNRNFMQCLQGAHNDALALS